MATVFRAPLIQRIERRNLPPAVHDVGWQNRLVTLLGAVVADPFLALDWPTPRRRAAAVIDPGWQNHLSTLLAPAPAGVTPFRPLLAVGI